ncbi:NAD-dependent epimerase/dehydratase family protein [Aquabacter spiritensis]|uniref:Uronate dehydrogenase n=1 Tax=Aquabacter spiritensis TaxID=933073 RepID=A0A4R3LLJ6_9HYPH|nr:NAD(P)-dependent oxidoreductase [Aquabacter spiritensis]TCT01104.1 uronate dehydrogenase [Aquabacter spiritensis]
MLGLPETAGPLPHKVLVTGATGRVGRVLRRKLAGRYQVLRLADIVPLEAGPDEEVCRLDVTDPATIAAALEGIDCVVHLAGQAVEADWTVLFDKNIMGVANLFEAAREKGVERVVFTSSHHAVGFYRRDAVIGNDVAPRPDSRYGVSKVFGEALGRLYADKYGLAVACIRIGVVRPRPEDLRHLSVWISEDDFARLVARCIEAPRYHYLMLYGVSANPRAFWTNPDADKIGYVPQDSAEDHAAGLAERPTGHGAVTALFQGGYYCAAEFAGDPSQVD